MALPHGRSRRRGSVCGVLLVGLLGLAGVGLPGCTGVQNIGQRSEPTQLYILSGIERSSQDAARPAGLVLGVGPVQVAEHLNRPQILGLKTANRLEAAEFDHWAAPLDREVLRVLTENLSALLGTDKVVAHPWARAVALDYQVSLDLLHFEATPDGAVRLAAFWQIADADGRRTLAMDRTEYRQAVAAPGDADARVAAFSRLVATLSTAIAERLRGLSAQS